MPTKITEDELYKELFNPLMVKTIFFLSHYYLGFSFVTFFATFFTSKNAALLMVSNELFLASFRLQGRNGVHV